MSQPSGAYADARRDPYAGPPPDPYGPDPYTGPAYDPYGGTPPDPYRRAAYTGPPSDPYGGTPPEPYTGPPSDPYTGPPSDPYAGPPSDPYGGTPSDPWRDAYTGPPSDPYVGPPPEPYTGPPSDPYGGTPSDPYRRDAYTGPPTSPYPSAGPDPYAGPPSVPQPTVAAPRRYLGTPAGASDEPRGQRYPAAPGSTSDFAAGSPDEGFGSGLPTDPYLDRAAPDAFLWPSADPGHVDYGGQTAPRQAHPGPPEISGPLRVTPWPDHPAVSGPMPAVPAQPAPFSARDAHPRAHGGDADQDEPGGSYGWAPPDDDTSGQLVPLGPGSRKGRGGRPKRRGRRFSAPLIALLVLALFLTGGGVVGYHFLRVYVIPPDYPGSGYGTVVVQIKKNQTATDVAQALFSLGVVASARAFVKAAEQSSRPTALEPGFYRLHRHMKAALAFDLLLNPGARIQLKVTIPEGLRASQIVARLGAQSGIPLARYQAALADPAALGLPSYARNQPEGYLFPATYSVQPSMTATDVLRAMVKQFDAEAARINLVATARSVNLAPQEAIIVASLVQAEGGRVADFPKIARVIYNRLAINMRLQLDSTVMYALHRYGILATNQQLQVRSPYNTYQRTGLPPGPIDNPGDAAIQAALHPAAGNWLYFVTVNPKTGLTEFTSDPATFAKLRAELAKNLGQGR